MLSRGEAVEAMSANRWVLAAACVVPAAPAGRGEDWLQWRGPNLNGSAGERIFLVSTDSRNADLLGMCLGLKDGSALWSRTLSKGKPRQSATPRAIAVHPSPPSGRSAGVGSAAP